MKTSHTILHTENLFVKKTL